jgi:hypothetical protein
LSSTACVCDISDSQKQASAPKAKTIDELLNGGATVPSSALNVTTSDTKSMENSHSLDTSHDAASTKPDPVSANAPTATAGDKDRKLNGKTNRPKSGIQEDVDNEASVNVPEDKMESRGPPASGQKLASKASVKRDRHVGKGNAVKTTTNKTVLSNGEHIGNQSFDNSDADTGNTGAARLNTTSVGAAQSQHIRQAEASAGDSKGRPQRQAKQTALGKLKAKHSKTDSDVDDMTDDSQDDGFDIAARSKQSKKVADRKQNAKHLPTPVTEGNLPNKQAETKSNGELKPAKQQKTHATSTAKKQPTKTSSRDTAAPSERVGRSGNSSTQKEGAILSTVARSSQSSPEHRATGTIAASHNKQRMSEDTPPPRRPGALKRPGRPQSRGRRPQTETPYDFPGTSSNTRKKRRSIPRASKASAARAGPTRQRMQSESVKKRLDRANDDLQLPSVSRQTPHRIGETKGRLRKPSGSRRKDDNSRPPPKALTRDNATQHESHISQPVRGSYTANLESHKAATSSKQTGTRGKPGSSQAHAIMIEQDSRSESSSSPSPRKPAVHLSRATGQLRSRQSHIERAQTPAIMPSSPPRSGIGSAYMLAKDKPTIIAFSRHGPRNQGVSSAKKDSEPAASSKMLFDHMSAKAGTPEDHAKTIGLATQLFPPSSQLSHRLSTQRKHTAEPGNVAKRDESAFRDFTINGKNKALAHMLRRPSEVANELGQDDQDKGFAVIDDFEGTTLIDDNEQPDYSPKQPTASQVAMPPPNVVTRGRNDLKPASASVKLPVKTAAKAAATKDTPRPAPTKKATDVTKSKGASISVPDEQTSTLSIKDGPIRKIEMAMFTDNAAYSKPLIGQTMAQQSQKPRKRGLVEPHPGSPVKRIRVSQDNMLAVPEARLSVVHKAPESLSVQMKNPADRQDRRKSRSSRRSTQTSQGVDILGSPYPKDLEVPKQTTALEVFSQQAGLSSDQTERSDAAPNGRLDLQAISRMVPTTKGGLASGNGLPVPAAPRGRSKAVTRIASGTLADQLLAVRSVQSSEENPFTSSRKSESSAGQKPAATKFREALRKRGIDLSDRPTVVRSEELGDGGFDDVEDTLVEPADDLEKANEHVERSPGVSEASRANSPDAAATVLEDVGDWRNSLKPHQSHLFDSLVIAAHKLVRHMVDHETADRTMVADYRRRGEIIVDELQRAHAKEYQQYTQNVQDWKIQAADELAAHGRKLKQSMRDAEKARAERKKRLLAWNGFDDVLEELVAGLD